MLCSVDRVDNGFIASVARIVDNTEVRLKFLTLREVGTRNRSPF